MTDKIIKFRRDTAFRKTFFVPDSFAHPAKMDSQLLIWIIEKFTKEGETILDPMAGSGTTMLACTLGRNVVLVELEEKFCKMCRDNWEIVKMHPQLGSIMGACQIIQGDARNLREVLYGNTNSSGLVNYINDMDIGEDFNKVDKIVTSPPYEEAMGEKHHSPRADKLAREKSNPVTYTDRVDKIITSPPYAGTVQQAGGNIKDDFKGFIGKSCIEVRKYSDDPANLGNLPYGQIDKIVTSPPYADQVMRSDQPDRKYEIVSKLVADGGKVSKRTLSWLKAYPKGEQQPLYQQTGEGAYNPDNPNNIGNLKYGEIDKIITSPPYEGSDVSQTHMTSDKRGDKENPEYRPSWKTKLAEGYAESKRPYSENNSNNIGNLKGDTYLEAMYQVYCQCRKVLRDGGLMILVTKNFIRNKKVVRLDEDTIKLCERAGFKFIDEYKRKLPSQSFWRVIYHQKYPDVEPIEFEEILIFGKGDRGIGRNRQ